MKKIGIVVSGGGMSCAYSVGVILALVEKYKFTKPYLIVGGSGATGTLAYYVSGQFNSIRNIWENLLSTDRFVSFKRPTKVMDIDYLIDEVFGKQDLLDTKKIEQSNIKFFIGATNLESGKLEYLSNHDGKNIFELLRASCAIPIAFNKSVKVGRKKYIDGSIGHSFYSHVKKAREEGAEAIIAIDNSNRSPLADSLVHCWTFFQKPRFKRGFDVYSKSKIFKLGPDIILMKPTSKLPTSTLDNNREHILGAISIGYGDLINNPSVKKLLSEAES